MECVKKLDVNSSSCLKPCSGLHVTSFSKTAAPNGLENLAPLLKDYDKYKKITEYPRGQTGNYANNNDNETSWPYFRVKLSCVFLMFA